MLYHFSLTQKKDYQAWRDKKLEQYPTCTNDLLIDIERHDQLNKAEMRNLKKCVGKANMALLQCTNKTTIDHAFLLELGRQIGLHESDRNLCSNQAAVSTITAANRPLASEYIPYTNRALSWHTDGYYNAANEQIRAWTLLCKQDAAIGGENALFDHEILYILLRDEDPAYIHALSTADVMTIPANVQEGRLIRPTRSGPVFSVDPVDNTLHMRYSARSKNIIWKQDDITQEALGFINSLFSSDSAYIFRHRMKPGQCLVSNNVLHNRTGFNDTDNRKRIVYRVRYLQRINLLAT